jgi:hypothetical protein
MSDCRIEQSFSRRDGLGCQPQGKDRLDNLEKKDRDIQNSPRILGRKYYLET